MPAAQGASTRKGRSTLRRYDLPLLEFHGREHGILNSIAYFGQTVKILCLRRAILLKWILYCLCALALALLQGLVLVYVRVWGVHPFLLPAIAVIPATLERNEQALLYAVFFGLVCDLLSPVAGLPCFYALAFLLGAAAAWLLSGQVIMAGVVCSLVVTGVCMLLCGLLHMAVLAGHSGAGLTAAGLLLGRELAVSLPFAAAAHTLFRWAQRRTLSE